MDHMEEKTVLITATHCADCGVTFPKPRTDRPRKTPYCRYCVGAHISKDPAVRAKRSASMKRHLSDPQNMEAFQKRTLAGLKEAMKTDAYKESRRLQGQRVNRDYHKWRLAWCPVEYVETYRTLMRKDFKSSEAKKMVKDLIERDQRKYMRTGVLPHADRQK